MGALNPDSKLCVLHCSKAYSGQPILQDISFTVRDGEFLSILGPSGCGKTTLLRILTGLVSPDSGTILKDGQDITHLPPDQRKIGIVFQNYALFENMTVLKNVAYALRFHAAFRGKEAAMAKDILERVGMGDALDKYPAQLSGGQQQRVALARILCSEPQAILLDEPFSALDSYLKWNLELELSDLLAGFHGPILWVSHDLGECCRNCQKVCVMENGASSPVTDTETLVRHPATQSAARLTGCRNFLPVRRCEGGVRLDGWDILLPLHAVGERATVAVPDGAITVEGGTHTARVSRVIRDLNATAVVLRAAEAPDAPPLCVVLPEGVRAAEGDTLSFSLLADRCRLWEE